MSDYMDDSGAEEYDFEYEDEDEIMDDDGNAQIENAYYQAKQTRTDSVEDSIAMFDSVITMEDTRGEWGFKALKQMFKLQFKDNQYPRAVKTWNQLITYVQVSAVTRNYADKSFHHLLDRIEKFSEDPAAFACLEQVYSNILEAFVNENDKRLWMKTSIRLAKLALERKDLIRAASIIRDVRSIGLDGISNDDPVKATFSIEIYALEILLSTETGNQVRLQSLYKKALALKTAVPHPKTMAIIRECGGKMYLDEENWSEAQKEFYESFRNYDEAGSPQRMRVLRYMVLAWLLDGGISVDPFDSPELRPYESDPSIATVVALKVAYARWSLDDYDSILEANKEELESDPFFTSVVGRLTRQIRMHALGRLVASHDSLKVNYIAKRLGIPLDDVIDLVMESIAAEEFHARIDDYNGIVYVYNEGNTNLIDVVSSGRRNLAVLSKYIRDNMDNGVVNPSPRILDIGSGRLGNNNGSSSKRPPSNGPTNSSRKARPNRSSRPSADSIINNAASARSQRFPIYDHHVEDGQVEDGRVAESRQFVEDALQTLDSARFPHLAAMLGRGSVPGPETEGHAHVGLPPGMMESAQTQRTTTTTTTTAVEPERGPSSGNTTFFTFTQTAGTSGQSFDPMLASTMSGVQMPVMFSMQGGNGAQPPLALLRDMFTFVQEANEQRRGGNGGGGPGAGGPGAGAGAGAGSGSGSGSGATGR